MHFYVKTAIHAINIVLFLVAVLYFSTLLRAMVIGFSAILYFILWIGNIDARRSDPIRREIARRRGWEWKNLGLNLDGWLILTSILNIIITIALITHYIVVLREPSVPPYPGLQDIGIGLLPALSLLYF